MTLERAAQLLRHIATITSPDEAHGFREQLRAQGEQLTPEVMRAIEARMGKKETNNVNR